MNKVAVTFVIVVISLAVIIQLDFSAEDIMPDIKPQSPLSSNIYNKYYLDYNLLNDISYHKDNSLSLRDNRLLSVLITQDMYGIKNNKEKSRNSNIAYNNFTDNL